MSLVVKRKVAKIVMARTVRSQAMICRPLIKTSATKGTAPYVALNILATAVWCCSNRDDGPRLLANGTVEGSAELVDSMVAYISYIVSIPAALFPLRR